MGQYLVAMTDGENVGFGVAQRGFSLSLDKVWSGKTVDFPTFIDALQHYLKLHDLQPRELAFALAVAGVPRGDILSLANCRWFLSVSGIRSFLRSEPLIINEFVAIAWSLKALDRSRLIAVGPHAPHDMRPGSTFAVVGVGFNLGVAMLRVTETGEAVVLESQGGHVSFAPQNEDEDWLLAHFRRLHGHVSYERILSDWGLQNVYQAIAGREGKRIDPPTTIDILAAARQRSDPIAVDALKIFASTLGSFIGNLALTTGAWDGVFLTGATLQELIAGLTHGEFRAQLTGKGPASKLLETVPVAYLNYDYVRLLGCAAALSARDNEHVAASPAPRLAVG